MISPPVFVFKTCVYTIYGAIWASPLAGKDGALPYKLLRHLRDPCRADAHIDPMF